VNDWERRAHERLKLMDGLDPRHGLAITAANEHFTALFAEWMLSHADGFKDTEPRLKTMWLWHSAEEAEHKCTAFDLYKALGGSEEWRLKWMRRVTVIFLTDTLRQTANNLRRDGTFWKWSTWKSGASFLFGARGMIRGNINPWRDYFRADFHPNQQHSVLSGNWLRDNTAAYSVVGQSG
jgi:predicted metal-dependent hydrolase